MRSREIQDLAVATAEVIRATAQHDSTQMEWQRHELGTMNAMGIGMGIGVGDMRNAMYMGMANGRHMGNGVAIPIWGMPWARGMGWGCSLGMGWAWATWGMQ